LFALAALIGTLNVKHTSMFNGLTPTRYHVYVA